ncbi:TRAF-like [Sesbania bispinosa]|nr:TRAF-like [Sesbania bispinosa]
MEWSERGWLGEMGGGGISRSIVDAPPAHYIVRIESFSLLAKNSIERYESGKFDAGGYKWKLVLYPSGNKSKNVKDYISLYLALDEPSSLHPGWEIYVNFRFFLFDQNNDNYLVVQDAVRKERRFHKMKVEWGFDQFIPLKDFNHGSKGYLVDDICAFGAEVFVCRERSKSKGESLIMMKDAIAYKQVWDINNFSKLDSECYDSKPFNAGNYKWKIKLYPKGKDAGLGSHLSLYLALANPTALSTGSRIYAQIILRILDQKQAKHHFGKANYWFSASSHENGASRFLLISNFTSQYLGYLVKDSCLVEAEVTILGVVDAFS